MRTPHRLPAVALAFAVGTTILSACAGDVVAPASSSNASLDRSNGEGDQASSAAHRDLNVVRAELLAADAAWASYGASQNLIESLVAPLASDGIFIAPGTGFLRGPDQVRAFLQQSPANAAAKWRWVTIRVDVSSDGEHGFTYGYSEQETASGAILPGKYQAYWTRQPDNTWKMSAMKRSPRQAGAVSLVPPAGFESPTNKHRRYFPNTEPATELGNLFAVDLAFSDEAQTEVAAAFGKYAAPNGAQAANGQTIWAFGPDAIRAAWAGTASTFTWAPQLGSVASSGDLGFTVGYVFTANGVGKYFTVWQKQPNGEWRYVVD